MTSIAYVTARDASAAGRSFVLTAVLVDESASATARSVVRDVHALPLRAALERLLTLPFTFYSIVVDAAQMPTDADLDFHRLLASMLDRRVVAQHVNLSLTLEPSLRGVADALARHHASSLFDQPRLHVSTPENEPLLRVPALLCEALAAAYAGDSDELLELITPGHALAIDEWPVRYRPTPGAPPSRAEGESDAAIARHAIAAAEGFVASHGSALDEDTRGQVLVLGRLLFEARFGEPRSYLSTEVLRQALAPVGKANESLHWLRSNVIAPLRDAGVLIASSARGYKLPLSVADVTDFVSRTDTVVHPMLHRVARARDAVRRVTQGHVDVLAHERFAQLRAAVDAASRTE